MKLNKILIPALSSLAITTSLLPLTSCNKNSNEGIVTEQEWKAAIDYLGYEGKEQTYWSFGKDDYAKLEMLKKSTRIASYNFTNWMASPSGVTAHCKYEEVEDPTATEDIDFYEKSIGSYIFTQDNNITKQKTGYEIQTIGDPHFPSSLIWIALNSVYEFYNDFKFNAEDKHYWFEGMREKYYSVKTRISFNSDKKVSHVECTLALYDAEYPAVASTDFNLNYEKKEITFPEGFADRVNKHHFNIDVSKGTSLDTSFCEEQDEGLVMDVVPTDSSYTTITAYDKDSKVVQMFSNELEIRKGDTKLEPTEHYNIKDNKIVFTQPLEKDCNISIRFKPQLTDATYTFKLEK